MNDHHSSAQHIPGTGGGEIRDTAPGSTMHPAIAAVIGRSTASPAALAAIAADREAREEQHRAVIAELREMDRPRREAEATAVEAAREAARNRPPTPSERVSADIREAMGTEESLQQRLRRSIGDKTREMIAAQAARSQARDVSGSLGA